MEPRFRLLLPFVLLTAVLAVSTSSVLIRFAQQAAPSLVIAALRLTSATLLLAPFVWARHRADLRDLGRKELVLGTAAGILLALHFAAWISSLEYTSVASSIVFVSTGPLWVALLSPMLLGERLTRGTMIGLGVALVGGTFIALAEACSLQDGLSCPEPAEILERGAIRGNLLALAGAWAVAGYLIIGRRLREGLALLPYIFLVYGIAAVVLIGLMWAAGQSPLGYPSSTYLWILLLAIFPQLIGHSTYNWVLRYIPATLVAVLTLVEPLGSAALAYLILSEVPSSGVIAGGLLILAGVYLAVRSARPAALS